MTCEQCKYITVCMAQADGLGQVFDPNYDGEHGCTDFAPFINADRIRAMSDEELAVFLSRGLKEPCDYCQLAVFEGACTETLCEDAMMKWLQQPAEKPKEDA